MNLEPMKTEWVNMLRNEAVIPTDFQIMVNNSGELFVSYKGMTLRLTPRSNDLYISDYNQPGKFKLAHGIIFSKEG